MYGLNPALLLWIKGNFGDLKGDWGVNLELTAVYLSAHQATAGPKYAIWELGSLRQTQVQGSRWQLLKHELVARRNYGLHSERLFQGNLCCFSRVGASRDLVALGLCRSTHRDRYVVYIRMEVSYVWIYTERGRERERDRKKERKKVSE